MKKFLKEFRDFAVKGNVVDMAIGVIIGGAFGKVVASLVNDVILGVLASFFGTISFENLRWRAVGYGNFITAVVNFVIIAFCMFLVVKGMVMLKKKSAEEEAAAPAEPSKEELLLAEIRDILKSK
ncbi:MAG: large conductance mechanosensitive channel protein MscL [Lachnospiraceae bacterium]|nr:large conductance mechanosensitive channel protein MscL [Lachnospiraceae bacterium]MDY5742425.1 large conductance mechanosensitive channel protein MscL [Lachnospiraceae bacterium]